MKVRIKKLHPDAVIPFYGSEYAAGADLTATSKEYDADGNVVYGIGFAIEIPVGYVGLLFPRSSNAKKDLDLTNCVGVLDSDYRGEVKFKFRPRYFMPSIRTLLFPKSKHINIKYFRAREYNVGERAAQLVIVRKSTAEFELADELSETKRGNGGYGSTGK